MLIMADQNADPPKSPFSVRNTFLEFGTTRPAFHKWSTMPLPSGTDSEADGAIPMINFPASIPENDSRGFPSPQVCDVL